METLEYIYRKKKKKYKYHIKTKTGTVCRMENSTCFKKLDTISSVPPVDRKLCQMCDIVYNNKPLTFDEGIERFEWEREATWD